MKLTLMIVTYIAGPLAGDASLIPYPSAHRCGAAMPQIEAGLGYHADLQCYETLAPSASPIPKGRPDE